MKAGTIFFLGGGYLGRSDLQFRKFRVVVKRGVSGLRVTGSFRCFGCWRFCTLETRFWGFRL